MVTSPQPPVPPRVITDAALDAAMAVVPDRHLGYLGGWEPAIDRRDMRRVLEAAAPLLAAAEREACAHLAEEHAASYQVTCTMQDCPCPPGTSVHRLPFAALLREARP